MKDTLGRENRKLEDRICPECGMAFRPIRKSSKYCSRKCLWANNGGQNRKEEVWWKNNRGYIEGKIWLGDKQIRVKQHRWIMEKHLGRALLPNEDVHHRNGDKTDNSIENLELVLHGEHATEHNYSRIYGHGRKINISDDERKARSERMRQMRRKDGRVTSQLRSA